MSETVQQMLRGISHHKLLLPWQHTTTFCRVLCAPSLGVAGSWGYFRGVDVLAAWTKGKVTFVCTRISVFGHVLSLCPYLAMCSHVRSCVRVISLFGHGKWSWVAWNVRDVRGFEKYANSFLCGMMVLSKSKYKGYFMKSSACRVFQLVLCDVCKHM